MNDYILIQKRNVKAPLLSARSEDNVYKCKFGKRCWNMSHYEESCFLTQIHSYRKSTVTNRLRQRFPDIYPEEIDSFFATFASDHPLEEIEYKYEDVPVISDESGYCMLYSDIFANGVPISHKQEIELIEMIKK